MRTKNLLIAIALTVTFVPALAAQTGRFNFETRLGVFDRVRQKGICLAIANSTLANGANVTLVSPQRPQATARARITQRTNTTCSPSPATSDGLSFYLVKLVKSDRGFVRNDEPLSPGIAIVGAPLKFTPKAGTVSMDVDGDGRRDYFRTCTSNEGVHLTVWTGLPLKGKLRWRSAYYLGYDVVPTCKEGDYKKIRDAAHDAAPAEIDYREAVPAPAQGCRFGYPG
jgi:hypothetical protein